MKVRDILRLLTVDGWVLKARVGSHRQLVHSVKPGKVTVAGHGNDDVPPGTLKRILEQAGLRKTP